MAENVHVDCSEPQWDVKSSGTFSGETRAVSVNRLQLQSKYTIETTLWGSFTGQGLLNLTDASDLQWKIVTSDIHDETNETFLCGGLFSGRMNISADLQEIKFPPA